MRGKRRIVCAIGFLCMIGVLGVACGGGGGGGSTPETAFDQGTIEAEAVIDSSGGTVEVTDPSSPLYDARVQFPEGARATEETIQIIHHSDYPALPPDATPNGPVVGLERSGQEVFDEAVVVQLPVAQTDVQQEDEYFDVLTYDEETGEWIRAQCWYDYEQGEMVLLVTGFSKFTSIIRSYQGPGETWTTFNMDIDTMVFQNEGNAAECPEFGGVCRGMAIFAQWFFENVGHGLRCYYDYVTGRKVSCDTHRDSATFECAKGAVGELFLTVLDHKATCVSLWLSLLNNEPDTLMMVPELVSGRRPHAVVVFAWVTTSPSGGYFVAYDVNDNTTPLRIFVEVNSFPELLYKPITMYVEGQPEFKLFGTIYGWLHKRASGAPDIYARYPSDDVCVTDPQVAGTWNFKYKWQLAGEGQDTLLLLRSGIWINQDLEIFSGKWDVQGLQLTVRFQDPTFLFHSTWRGNLNASKNSVIGTMKQYRASDLSQIDQGVFEATRISK